MSMEVHSDDHLAGVGVIVKNTFLNLIGRGLPIIVGLIAIPITVRWLGEARYGVFSLSWELLALFFVFDLGLGRTATQFTARALARADHAAIPRIIWSTVSVQFFFGALGGLLVAAVAPIAATQWFQIPPEQIALIQEARWCIYALAANIAISLIEYSLSGALEARQRFDIVNLIRVVFSVAGSLVIILVAGMDWNLVVFFIINFVLRILSSLSFFIACTRVFPGDWFKPRFSWSTLRELFNYGKWVAVSSILNPFLVYFDRICLPILVGFDLVAFYMVPYQVAERLLIIPATLSTTLFPALSVLDGRGDHNVISHLSTQSLKFLIAAMGLIAAVFIGFAHPLMLLLFGVEYGEHSTLVFRILCIGFSVNAIAFIPYAVIQACGRPDITAKFHLIEFPIHMLLLFSLGWIWSLAGVALAWSLRVSLDAALLFAYTFHKNLLHRDHLREHKVLRLLYMVVAVNAAAFLLDGVHLTALVVATILPILSALLIYWLCFTPQERSRVWVYLRKIRAKFAT
ncbi:MAG: flippase [Candidatus Hydrogenedentes bacterium]|nr:flippase [Candidatus Hydrogenedentota bacterium]